MTRVCAALLSSLLIAAAVLSGSGRPGGQALPAPTPAPLVLW